MKDRARKLSEQQSQLAQGEVGRMRAQTDAASRELLELRHSHGRLRKVLSMSIIIIFPHPGSPLIFAGSCGSRGGNDPLEEEGGNVGEGSQEVESENRGAEEGTREVGGPNGRECQQY